MHVGGAWMLLGLGMAIIRSMYTGGSVSLTLGACARGSVVVLCVCVCVCVLPRQLLHTWLYDANKVSVGCLRHFQGRNCVDFIENASFKSSGDIC